MTGTLNMNSNNISNGGIINITNSTEASSTSVASLTSAGGIGIVKKAFIGSNTVMGPSQTITLEQLLTLRGTNISSTAGPHLVAYTSADQYPLLQNLNWEHN